MKSRPIIFSAPMVKAILEGRKIQTRRILKPQPSEGWTPHSYGEVHKMENGEPNPNKVIGWGYSNQEGDEAFPCPYGNPGDLLWVRETWALYQTVNYICRSDGRAFSEVSDGLAIYKADGHDTIEDARDHIRLMSDYSLEAIEIDGNRWKPSIYMPRWASRITLKITDIRVERLNNISEKEAQAEGAIPKWDNGDLYREEFKNLWQSINGAESWDANPWVWVIEFEAFHKNIDAVLRG